MNNQELGNAVEGLLFAQGGPMSRKELCRAFGVDAETLEAGIQELLRRPFKTGIVLVDDGTQIELRAAPEASEVIDRIRKEEYSREIGKAGLEALAAVLYRGPLSRSEIDFIRGVNSSQTIRTLLMRGLVRKVPNPRDERSFLYEATTELLSALGAQDTRDLPQYTEVQEKLTTLEASYRSGQEPR